MTDGELLERTATAAGFTWCWIGNVFYTMRNEATGLVEPWNPLEDDGDALRLAVKLELSVSRGDCTCCVSVYSRTQDEPLAEECFRHFGWNDEIGPVCERHENEYAATRRAIVRAAAALS